MSVLVSSSSIFMFQLISHFRECEAKLKLIAGASKHVGMVLNCGLFGRDIKVF